MQARLRVTPRSQNLRLGAPPSPPPRFPAEGSGGKYLVDSGPLLDFGVIPARFVYCVIISAPACTPPSRVAEEIERLASGDNAVERAAATNALRSITSGFPIVETLTSEEADFAERRLFDHLAALRRQPSGPMAGRHLGECMHWPSHSASGLAPPFC